MKNEDAQLVYVIKKRVTIELNGKPFEYEELVGKCTGGIALEQMLQQHSDAYIAETMRHSDSEILSQD